MSGEFINQSFPRGPLLGAGALVAFALLATSFSRLQLNGTDETGFGDPLDVASLRFADRADGSVVVTDSRTGGSVGTIEPASGGFVRATLRALSRERKRTQVGAEAPFELRRYEGGRLELVDSATGRHVYLDAFGPTNADAFGRLLAAASVSR